MTLDIGADKVALIRDPQGAGFTIYEGDALPTTRTSNQANTLIWNELHVSTVNNIQPFYTGIFDWTFEQDPHDCDHYRIFNSERQHIADALEIANDVKGKYEYWVCTFGTTDLQATKQRVIDNGGTVVMDEHDRIMMTDNSQQAFFYIKTVDSNNILSIKQHKNQTEASRHAVSWLPQKWKSILGLIIIFTGVLAEQYWLFGVFFLIWLIMDIRAGATHLFEPIKKSEAPILYWITIATWGILSAFSFVSYY